VWEGKKMWGTRVVTEPAVADAIVPKKEQLRPTDWLFRSNYASVIWLVVRLWLGYQWLDAGYQKIWGSEKMVFWYGGGAGVYGFAKAGVSANQTPMGAVGFGWWAGFLHNFVMPNAAWIAKMISLGEIAVGIGLILGLFTGIAAFAAVSLNFTYMMTGTAGVNPLYALAGVGIALAWRNAGLLGLDRYVLKAVGTPFHVGPVVRRLARRRMIVQPSLSFTANAES
jgi:thiosulfate dehydrogenase [quinone] large subunit